MKKQNVKTRVVTLMLAALLLSAMIASTSCTLSDGNTQESETAPQVPLTTTTRVTLPTPIATTTKKRTLLPDDFSFKIIWNCYGDSTYDSKSGQLVKQKSATILSDYTATMMLTDEEKLFVYRLLTEYIDLFSYPDVYDPTYPCRSKPAETVIVTMIANGEKKRVECPHVAFVDVGDCGTKEGQDFMRVVKTIVEMLTATEEWNAFPEYEHFYY